MDYLSGGDLMNVLIQRETLNEEETKFFVAEIAAALAAVHRLGYVHRDLKPDNVLRNKEGHIELTDFGLSAGLHAQHRNIFHTAFYKGDHSETSGTPAHSLSGESNKTVASGVGDEALVTSAMQLSNPQARLRRSIVFSTVGTPDYIAPEVFGLQGYSYSCDWWSLGILMYVLAICFGISKI